MNRRQFLKLPLALMLAGGLARHSWADEKYLLIGCRSDKTGKYFLSAIDQSGQAALDIQLPGRGHGLCSRPNSDECIVFARRPGNFFWVVDVRSGTVVHRISGSHDRHYYGHGEFDHHGNLLYVTENDFESGRGVIGVYDASDHYRRVAEYSSHGVGPHQLKFLSDGKTLVIANGGIRTHPDTGRSKLNLPDMKPSLSYLDSATGDLLAAYEPPPEWHQLSIRHLDVNANDMVCIAMQYQGQGSQQPPLIATHQGEESLRWFQAPPEIQKRMHNYCGDIHFDTSGQIIAASSPRGNLVTLWSSKDGQFVEAIEYNDGCGVTADTTAGCFFISNGHGMLARVIYPGMTRAMAWKLWPEWRWDNHLIML